MAAHRYWRASALEGYGAGDLELSEFQLVSGGSRVDAAATLTSSNAPDVSGALADLKDASLTTSARWSAHLVPSLTLDWDFGGSPVDVDDIKLAGASNSRFPLIVKVQSSDDAASWTTLAVIAGVGWKGAAAYSTNLVGVAEYSVQLKFDGANGSTNFIDEKGATWSRGGTPTISTAQSKFGGASGLFNGVDQYISTPADYAKHMFTTAGDWTAEMFVRCTSPTSTQNVAGFADAAGGSAAWLIRITSSGGVLFAAYNGSTYVIAAAPAASIVANTWHHIACVKDGSTFRLFVDGVMFTAAFTGAAQALISPLCIGRMGDYEADYLGGHVDSFSIQNGFAKYKAAFTPPTTDPADAVSGLGRIKGRASTEGTYLALGGPEIVYGLPQLAAPKYLGIESGAVKDSISGVLGQGIGRVRGTVKITPATPTHRKVRLIRERDNMLIREQWSNADTGEYDFQFVDELQTFTVLAYDYTGAYRAVVADGIVPEVMP